MIQFVNWSTPAWEQFKVDVTDRDPLPHYMAMGFDGGYTGI